jgi:hypothetical protein
MCPDGTSVGRAGPSCEFAACPGGAVATGTPKVPTGAAAFLQSGTQGNIVITNSGATVIGNARDTQANSEVAGFYGSDAGAAQPQGVAANLCKNRPWANAIVSFIIPPTFFDSLCAWRGYAVGAPKVETKTQSPVILQQNPKPSTSQPAATTSAPAAPVVTGEPFVDVWAVPMQVPLGARTSVFWNTKNVVSCTVSSPDGSFKETTLSGGASTVPLTGATTFTISCLTADDKPVTDYVTVNLAI